MTTDAHYRESENSGNPYFAFSFRSRFFHQNGENSTKTAVELIISAAIIR
ncbi:hypothetical protein AB6H14_19035 [Providencia vermicola]